MTTPHHCPCPEGCRDCEWTCPGKGCPNDPKNDPDCPPDEENE